MALPSINQPASTTAPDPQGAQVISLGPVRASNLAQVQTNEANKARADAQVQQATPLLTGIAAHVRKAWIMARDAKQQSGGIEQRMLENLRARRREYDPDKLSAIAAMGGSDVYVGITAVKCRAAASWLRDVLMTESFDRPWAIKPTPIPELPPELNAQIVQRVAKAVLANSVAGIEMDQDAVVEQMHLIKSEALNAAKEGAQEKADLMADKMADQMDEGGFRQALDEFIDDLTTFPSACLKGPVLRRKPRLSWGQVMGTTTFTPVVKDDIVLEWERVSPFDIYPSPGATDISDGDLIERHRLRRTDLQDLLGVKGYNDGAIKLALEDYGKGGLVEWLVDDVRRAEAEGMSTPHAAMNSDGLIDALQFWGSVQGQMLRDWGMDVKQVPDPLKEYQVEAWLVGRHVIKAVLNQDPLRRRPYYMCSYEEVPGSIWGNSVADLVRDMQLVANAAARALVNNMGMASGPQVVVNVDRLPAGEQLSTLQAWKVWQVNNDPAGNNSTANKPIDFFQPQSNAQELMAIFEKFSQMADEYSGIPRYMTGDATGGAGRTASGLSMLISNAGKTIKAVLGNIDINILEPLLQRLYEHNMRYATDPDLKGDCQIVARGAGALVAKESAQVRRSEFLIATNNPTDLQIMGLTGRAALLRENAKGLDMNVDKIVPPVDVLKARLANESMALPPAQGTPAKPSGNGQALTDGAPVTDNFSPPAQ